MPRSGSAASAARRGEAFGGVGAHAAEASQQRLAAGSLDAGLSRGLAGISGSTLVVNIAGSRSAVRDGMATLCPMAAQVIFELSSLEL
jgi:molybdopterin biosynthesis enzyme MoaB